jgi:hypothetical protein
MLSGGANVKIVHAAKSRLFIAAGMQDFWLNIHLCIDGLTAIGTKFLFMGQHKTAL